MPKVEFTCGSCAKKFLDYESQRLTQGRKSVFCSRQCKYEWNKMQPGYWKGKKMSETARNRMSRNHADVIGSKNPRWKGGRRIDKDGYVLIWKPEHPHADYHGYVREHRLVIEKHLGRILKPEENIHHIDGSKQNNKFKNLKLFSSTAEHLKHHYETGTGGAGKLKNRR